MLVPQSTVTEGREERVEGLGQGSGHVGKGVPPWRHVVGQAPLGKPISASSTLELPHTKRTCCGRATSSSFVAHEKVQVVFVELQATLTDGGGTLDVRAHGQPHSGKCPPLTQAVGQLVAYDANASLGSSRSQSITNGDGNNGDDGGNPPLLVHDRVHVSFVQFAVAVAVAVTFRDGSTHGVSPGDALHP